MWYCCIDKCIVYLYRSTITPVQYYLLKYISLDVNETSCVVLHAYKTAQYSYLYCTVLVLYWRVHNAARIVAMYPLRVENNQAVATNGFKNALVGSPMCMQPTSLTIAETQRTTAACRPDKSRPWSHHRRGRSLVQLRRDLRRRKPGGAGPRRALGAHRRVCDRDDHGPVRSSVRVVSQANREGSPSKWRRSRWIPSDSWG